MRTATAVAAATLAAAAHSGIASATVPCGGGRFSCPDANTCCPRPDGSFGCVPSEAGVAGDAVCCSGGALACPVNYTCVAGGVLSDLSASASSTSSPQPSFRAVRDGGAGASPTPLCMSVAGPQPDPKLSADWPYPMGMAGWQLPYNTCPAFDGPPPVFNLDLGAATGGLKFPYYSNVGALGSPGHEDVEVAMIVQHGAGRNADDYFCSGLRAASLWTAATGGSKEEIAIVAPRFMEPADSPPANTAWWNGTFPIGYWRAGAQSDPAASPSAHATVSSFAVLDDLVSALAANKRAYPNLRLVVLAGHSSGGQIVQRHALFTRVPPSATTTTTTTTKATSANANGASALPAAANTTRVRHVVANPSSFAYLDGRRWVNSTLRMLTAAEQMACPLFDDWQFGLRAGLPPFCTGANASASAAAAVAAYPSRDVVYVQGFNDTCDERVIPGCDSHGLETTCMDMLEGRFRLERGRQYAQYLEAFYGKPTHRLVVVPDVGHDHSLVWDGSLVHIFGDDDDGQGGHGN